MSLTLNGTQMGDYVIKFHWCASLFISTKFHFRYFRIIIVNKGVRCFINKNEPSPVVIESLGFTKDYKFGMSEKKYQKYIFQLEFSHHFFFVWREYESTAGVTPKRKHTC